MNDGVIGIVFSLVYVSLKEFGVVGSDKVHVYNYTYIICNVYMYLYMYNYVYICIIMADLHCCMAETITTLKNNFPPIKK